MANQIEEDIVGLYERYLEGIYCFCLCRLYNKHLAEEATSEVFLKLVEKYPLLIENRKKKQAERIIRNWLYGTAKNAIAKQIRQHKHRKDVLKEIAYHKQEIRNDSPEFDKHHYGILLKAVGMLNAKEQEILVHRYFKGYKTATIAEIMGMDHGTVRVRLSRTIKKLKTIMGNGHE